MLVLSPVSAASIRALAAAVVRAERAALQSLSISVVGPARMRALNKRHLGHDRDTDVIAFSLGDAAAPVGDVYICPAVAARNARAFGTTPHDELRRLVVHGVLHVLGYDHPAGSSRVTSAMWKRQERHLEALAGRAR